MIYIITGHLGSGKTLLAVELARQYLAAGKSVASNMTLALDVGLPPRSRATATKLPYIPTSEHLNALGNGYDGDYDEDRFGLILLDEAGTWLNTRDWQDKERRGLFQWITHARKYGWDVALIVQDWEALDNQIRRAVCEIYVKCTRLDRVKLPYLPLKLPRIHRATAKYGGPDGPLYKRWHTSGTELFMFYNTREAVRQEVTYTESGPIDARGSWTMLSAWHLKGRYLPPRRPFSAALFIARCFALAARFLAGLVAQRPAQPTPAARPPTPSILIASDLAAYRLARLQARPKPVQ